MKDGIRSLGYNVTKASHNFEKVETELFRNRPVIMGGNDDNVPLPEPLDYIGSSHYWVCDGAHRITTNQMYYFTIWQPNGNGTFTTGWHSMETQSQSNISAAEITMDGLLSRVQTQVMVISNIQDWTFILLNHKFYEKDNNIWLIDFAVSNRYFL